MNSSRPSVISHRTNCGGAPENSLSGIKAAVKLGVDKIELDVQRTRDGYLVLMHDLTLDRTTSGNGRVRDLEYRELQKLHLLSEQFYGEKIPLLEEVFSFVFPFSVNLLLEVKSPVKYPKIGEDLVRLIEKYSMAERVEILCFDWNFLRTLNKEYPLLFTCALSSLPFNAGNGNNFDALGIYYPSLLLRSSLGFSLPRANRIYAGTPTSETSMRKLAEIGVDGIITDAPELLLKILKV